MKIPFFERSGFRATVKKVSKSKKDFKLRFWRKNTDVFGHDYFEHFETYSGTIDELAYKSGHFITINSIKYLVIERYPNMKFEDL